MTRFVPVTVLVLLAAIRVANADIGTLPNGAMLAFDRLFIHEDGNPELKEPAVTPNSLWKYFNLAHCQCGKLVPDFLENKFAYQMTLSANTNTGRALDFWVGPACDTMDTPTRNAQCHQVKSASISSIDTIQAGMTTVQIPVYDFMTPAGVTDTAGPDCAETEQDATLWALADINPQDGQADFSLSKPIKIDSKAPDLPTEFRAFGGDKSIVISWTPPVSNIDVDAYQVLCARADGGAPGVSDPPDPRYLTALSLCGMGPGIDLGEGQAIANGGDPVTFDDLPEGLQSVDPMFLCGDVQSSTATSIRINGLENGVAYKVVLLTMDKFWNARGTFFTSTLTPVPSTDFWEDLHNQGGNADGGLCLLAETYGDDSSLTGALRAFRDETLAQTSVGRWLTDVYYSSLGRLGGIVHGSMALRVIAAIVLAPLVGLALLWHWLTLPGLIAVIALLWLWRRYRRRVGRWFPRLAAAAGVAIVALAPARAHAGGYQPYWENSNIKPDEPEVGPNDPSLVHWHAGIRVGPYLPSIDSKLGLTPGPFKQMFHGARPMPTLDVDRFLWNGFGQAGIGFSIGYMQWFEHAFVDGSSPEDNPRMRSPADTNTFRLVPMALTAVYRYTQLDDDYGIPVVLYARGGLSYYLWWLSSNGSVAQICSDATASASCGNKALGASLGLQGSIGIAIRAERIDASTAMSMQQSGIQHAGIYAELSLAKVDGFGSESKLSVGDATWFAGVDFEF